MTRCDLDADRAVGTSRFGCSLRHGYPTDARHTVNGSRRRSLRDACRPVRYSRDAASYWRGRPV